MILDQTRSRQLDGDLDNLTLVQSNCSSSVFSDPSNEDLGEETGKAIEDAKCWFGTRTYTQDADGNENTDVRFLYFT